jgi:hypothetical protein
LARPWLPDPDMASKLAVLAEHPIRALTWADQVRARLWVRNGDEVRRLVGPGRCQRTPFIPGNWVKRHHTDLDVR